MAWFSSKVKVTFINDATGETFAATEISPSELPASFDIDTTLHLGSEDWSVIDAQPRSRDEFAKSKELTLRLRRIEKIDPKEILFSLPSICDAIPSVSNQPLSGNEFILSEDDWRQFEFVSNRLNSEIEEEIEKIRWIHDNASAGVGWRKLHVRSKPAVPIVDELTVANLAHALRASTGSIGVTYRGARSQIADGYAFKLDGLTVYGTVAHGKVQTIAFDPYSEAIPSAATITLLKSLAQDLGLDLVYWCRCERAGPDSPLFGILLTKESS